MVIRKTSPKEWTLYSKHKHNGRRKVLGRFNSLTKAKTRERQIQYFKNKK